jgi:hypothetical protein
MQTKNVHIREGECTPTPIEIDKPIVGADQGDTVKFHNHLGAPATITFYELMDKGGTPKSGVCSSTLPAIGSGSKEDCVLATGDDVSYEIAAAGYKTLDPVLIIEPMAEMPVKKPFWDAPFWGFGSTIIALVLGFLIAKMMTRKTQ